MPKFLGQQAGNSMWQPEEVLLSWEQSTLVLIFKAFN
jgi:hypothetical protein